MAAVIKTLPFRTGIPMRGLSLKPLMLVSLHRSSVDFRVSCPCSRRHLRFVRFAAGEAEMHEAADASAVEDPSLDVEGWTAKDAIQSYREAIARNDEDKAAEIEFFFKSLEEEKLDLQKRAASLSAELPVAKDRALSVAAGFNNFRKVTEFERISLVNEARGEVLQILSPVLELFEDAKTQLRHESEGEEKISGCYNNIYKQLVQVLASLDVDPAEKTHISADASFNNKLGSRFRQVIQELQRNFLPFIRPWMRF